MMTPESKVPRTKTIRAPREQLLAELKTALHGHDKLAVPLAKATLSPRRLRERRRRGSGTPYERRRKSRVDGHEVERVHSWPPAPQ